MSRFRIVAGLGLLTLVLQAGGAVIFEDDFSNANNSILNWASNDPDAVTMNFSGGKCLGENTADNTGGLIYHILNSGKPGTFTLSGKITRSSESVEAGFFFCLNISGAVSGYYARIGKDSYISVFRSDSMDALFSVQSPFVASATNELKISKKGSMFYVFCNDHKVGTFTDSKYPSGDIAMFLPNNTKATFDDIMLTDVLDTTTSVSTCFSDDFTNGDMFGWATMESDGNATIANGKLHVKTGKYAYVYTDMALNELVMRVDVSYISGSKNSMYGLFVKGEGEQLPIAGFIITGSRSYGVFKDNQPIPLTSNTAIRGAAVAGMVDTLGVRKSAGTGYIFSVNGINLDTLNDIGFEVTGAGVFCNDSLELDFDNFVVSNGDTDCQGTDIVWSQASRRPIYNKNAQQRFVFDPLGRLVKSANSSITHKRLSAGIYLKQGQKALVFKAVRE
ncbi:MAG: hypothetical protein GX556_00640 [Fibrobacter sp.]|nr:hypothetical protein [Fibrobacter sp.]